MLVDILSENSLQIPEKYKHMVEPDVGERICLDQKALNNKRKICARLDRLKKAQGRKEEQWNQFKATLKEHLLKEQQRYEQEKVELNNAILQAQTDLDKLMRNEEEETAPVLDEEMDPLEALLNENAATIPKTPKQQAAVPDEIKKTQADHQMLMQQVGELQQQMMYMVNAFSGPMAMSPTRSLPTMPVNTPQKTTPPKRSALEPFARAPVAKAQRALGPYGKVENKNGVETTEKAFPIMESDGEEERLRAAQDGYGED